MNLKNRREFLKSGAAFTALALIGTDVIPVSGKDLSPDDPAAAGFRRSMGKTVYLLMENFRISGEVTEVADFIPSAQERTVSPYRLESFTVKIAHEGPALPQDTYDFVSEDGGRQPLFVVPLPETDAEGRHLVVATFSRISKGRKPGRIF